MKQRSKILAVVLTLALVVTQFAVLPSLTFAAETTKIPDAIFNKAKTDRSPIIWFDFENVEPGSYSITDKVSGIVATHGEQQKVDDKARQWYSPIYTTDKYTINGSALWPKGNMDLLMPYEPLSQTGDEATIQAWVKMSSVENFHDLFWAGSVNGKENVQQKNFIGIHPRRGDTEAYSYVQASNKNNGNDGAKKIAATKNVQPAVGKWQLLTVTQTGKSAKVYLNDKEVASGDVHYLMSDLLTQVKSSDDKLTMNDLKMGIGSFADGWNDFTVKGLVDDFKIYNVALTANEVSEDYKAMETKISALPEVWETQHSGGPDYPVNPDFTRFAPASRGWNEYSWGYWTEKSGDFYLKTVMKVEKIPGKENSTASIGNLDWAGKTTYALPAVKDFEDGIWKPIVVKVTGAEAGKKEFRFQARNRDDLYTIHYGPYFIIDTDATPLALTATQVAQNNSYAASQAAFPNYKPYNFDPAKGFEYKLDGRDHDNFSHNDRAYMTSTPNGNYITSKRDLRNHLTWNGYMDRLGRAKENPLPAGKYDFIFAYKTEGTAYNKDLDEPNQNKDNPYLGYFDFRDQKIVIPIGSEETADGKWHVQVTTIDAKDGIKCDWEFRLRNLFNGDDFALSVGHIYIAPHQETPSITLDKNVYEVNESITINFSNLDKKHVISGKDVSGMKVVNADGTDIAGADYWIDLPKDDNRDLDNPTSYIYKFNAEGSDKNFKTLQPGEYKMLLEGDNKTEIMAIKFKVVDDAKVASVIDTLNKLPIAVQLTDEAAITAARNAYNALTAEQKALVNADVLKKLTDAEAALKVLKDNQNPGTKPGTNPETSDTVPVLAVLMMLAGAASLVIFKTKKFSNQ